jgi:hypothetical protein
MKGGDNLGDLGQNQRIILKWILQSEEVAYGLDSPGLNWFGMKLGTS